MDSEACGTNLDHGVLAVGYNTADGYWIVKNFGELLGENPVTLDLESVPPAPTESAVFYNNHPTQLLVILQDLDHPLDQPQLHPETTTKTQLTVVLLTNKLSKSKELTEISVP